MAKGPNVGTAWVTLALESKGVKPQIEKELKPVADEADKQSKKAGESFDSIGTKALAASLVGGAALFGLASAAGSLNAAMQTSNRAFGDAAEGVQAFAADTEDAVFLSEAAALKAANGFGIFGSQAGMGAAEAASFSVEMVQLAADLAAVADVPVDQAVQDLTSAFAGSTETMQKYGINLNETELKAAYFAETGERITGVMTSQQKTMATYWALLDKGSFAFGAAESEAGQFASQVDNLKAIVGNIAADFGQPVVGFAAGLLESISGGLGSLSTWNEETGGMLATGLAAGIGISTAGAAALGIASKVKGAVDSFSNLSKGMKIATGALGGVALAVTAGFLAYGYFTQESRELRERTAEVGSALGDATQEAWEYAAAAAGAAGDVDGLEVAQRALGIALVSTGEDGEKLTKAMGTLGLQVADAGEYILSFGADASDGSATAEEALFQLAMATGHFSEEQARMVAQVVNSTDDIDRFIVEPFDHMTEAQREVVLANEDVVRALEEFQDQAQKISTDEAAEDFLTTAAASDELANSLIEQAEVRAEGTRTGDQAFEVYTALNEIVGELTGTEQQAALEALGFADAQQEVATATDEVNNVAASSIDMVTNAAEAFDDAAAKVDAFRSALDQFLDPALSVQETGDALAAGWDDFAQVVADVENNVDGASLSMANNTEAGRANREMFRGQAEEIANHAEALLNDGRSADEVSNTMGTLRNQLIDQATAFFGSREAAERYVNSLGLTPESIETSIEMYGMEAAKQRVEDHLANLGEIPETEATRIEALIDQGNYAAAEAAINQLARDRSLQVYINAVARSGGGGGGRGPQAMAYGGPVAGGNPRLLLGGDAPWDEYMVTTGNIPHLRKQLEDDRLRGPVLQALDLEPQLVGVGGGAPKVQVFIGNEEITGRVRVVVQDELDQVGAAAMAGRV